MNVKYLVVHFSDSPVDRGDSAETIHRWHQEKGWDGIGYHYIILPNGRRQSGRPEYWEGAHVLGHNHESLGICLIGRSTFKIAQLAELRQLLTELVRRYPHAKVVGHRDLDKNRTCPGFDVRTWWEDDYLFQVVY